MDKKIITWANRVNSYCPLPEHDWKAEVARRLEAWLKEMVDKEHANRYLQEQQLMALRGARAKTWTEHQKAHQAEAAQYQTEEHQQTMTSDSTGLTGCEYDYGDSYAYAGTSQQGGSGG